MKGGYNFSFPTLLHFPGELLLTTPVNTLYGAGMAQNQPPLCYPAMLNPYSIYQSPVAGTSNHLQFEADMDSVSPTPSESLNRSDDRNKRSSWSLTEKRCLIASYNE